MKSQVKTLLEGVIWYRAKWDIFISMSGQFLTNVYMMQPEMKLFVGVM